MAITAEMADIAEVSLVEARKVAANARRGIAAAGEAASGKAVAALSELDTLIGRLETVVAQTRTRVAGGMPDSATRLVSLHDPDARPIKKGRIGKPVEFGYLAQVLDNADGIVVDHGLAVGNPPDGPLLGPALRRVKKLRGRAPREVTADRGYGAAAVDAEAAELGVGFVAIIRKGRQSMARQNVERSARFRRLIKWRTGAEGRISALKRNWGWGRCLMDGLAGAQTWCGYGVFAHNTVKISSLIAANEDPSPATGAGPPGQPPPSKLPISA